MLQGLYFPNSGKKAPNHLRLGASYPNGEETSGVVLAGSSFTCGPEHGLRNHAGKQDGQRDRGVQYRTWNI